MFSDCDLTAWHQPSITLRKNVLQKPMFLTFILFQLLMWPSIITLAASSHHIHHYLKRNRTDKSPYWPRESLWDALGVNPGSYVFGFNFGGSLGFWQFVFPILRGRSMKPIRGWMALWVCAATVMYLALIGLALCIVTSNARPQHNKPNSALRLMP